MKRNKLHSGTSGDAILLMLIKLVTIALGLVVTRLLSEHLSVYDYGTYSQILLVVSTVTSLTILGMMDGVNYFYCREPDQQKRESYISTIFALQCVISTAAGCVVMALSAPLCTHFDNPDVGQLLVFAAVLPLLQNLLSMMQILLVSVGKARLLAVRNFVVSVLRLIVVIVVVALVRNVAVILLTTVVLDVAQILLFGMILGKNDCAMGLQAVKVKLFGEIFRYCAPMAVFTVVSTLNRDLDKYLISLMTDTETLAVYANASKVLPFDIIMTSFTTVLIPQITRFVAEKNWDKAASLYKVFLEIAYVSTGILCCAALAVSPQLMQLLYSEKYLSGLPVFCIYVGVDLLRFTNITLVLSAAGKTKSLMFLGVGTLAANAALNVVLFNLMGIAGPAAATLLTTFGSGMLILLLGAKELRTKLRCFFDLKFLALFAGESLAAVAVLYLAQKWMAGMGVHYLIILVAVGAVYGIGMLVLNGKQLLRALKTVNQVTKREDG